MCTSVPNSPTYAGVSDVHVDFSATSVFYHMNQSAWIALFMEARVKLAANHFMAPSSEHAKYLKFFLIGEFGSEFLDELHKECNTLGEIQDVSMKFIKSLTHCVAVFSRGTNARSTQRTPCHGQDGSLFPVNEAFGNT